LEYRENKRLRIYPLRPAQPNRLLPARFLKIRFLFGIGGKTFQAAGLAGGGSLPGLFA
jgi:hypothetical protein